MTINTKRGTSKPSFEPSFIFILVRLAHWAQVVAGLRILDIAASQIL